MAENELVYRTLRLCASGGGYEALPARPTALDLRAIARSLDRHGIGVTDARVMLIVRTTPELTVARSGRILVKSGDGGAAQAALDRFFGAAGLTVRSSSGGSPATG